MEGNQFKIFSNWDPRAETPEILGRRMLQNLDTLSSISPYFRNWQFSNFTLDPLETEPDDARAAQFPLAEARDRMTKIVELGVRRDDDGDPDPVGGYSVSANNNETDISRSVSLMAWGAGLVDPRAGLRFAEFETAYREFPDPAIVTYPVFKAALLSVVSAWDVHQAQAYSDELRTHWQQPYKLFLDLAWMTYLSPELAEGYAPPGDVLVEHTDNGGILLTAAQDTFDTSNERHMEAAESIRDSLAEINADDEAKWNYIRSVPPPRPLKRWTRGM
ncbi:MAG: Imm52 family immunity protein [Rhizomicrobium sp.]|jgi:hypothetical protein